MSLTKPILLSVPAFDVANGYTFTFNVVGGNQVVGNTITITNNATGTQVYTHTQTSYKFENIVPPNALGLTNGSYYSATITTTDADGNTSPTSNSIQFYCYTEPTLQFANLPTANIINNSSYTFELTYSQNENELLNIYRYNLYDVYNNIIATSGDLYVGSSDNPPTNISYTFNGFNNDESYKVQVVGSTINGTDISSELYSFTSIYTAPNVYSQLVLDNNCEKGFINITSYLSSIEGTSIPDPPIYINNGEIDLSNIGDYLLWDEGYSINGNFTLRLWGKNLKINDTICLLYKTDNNNNRIIINYRQDDGGTFIEMCCYDNDSIPQYNYSNYIENPSTSDVVSIWIRRISNIYEVKIGVVE